MTYLDTSKIVARVIAEVSGTIATNGIQELSREERGGVSTFGYVRNCLIATAYNAVRALPGFNMSYGEFSRQVEAQITVDEPPEPFAANGFDYDNQAWVIDGTYRRCGHPDSMSCGCYGREHEGEMVSAAVAAKLGTIPFNAHRR